MPVAQRFPLYRYEIRREGETVETRWSLVPVAAAGYAGNDEPSEAHSMGNEPADAGQRHHAGEVEAPDGTTIASFDPPILEIPDRGRIDLLALLDPKGGTAGELAELVRIRRK
jgi:hypothetical protein